MAVNYNLMEVTCQKAVQGSSFPQGTQDYIFTIGQPNCWCPCKSYFKIDMQVVGNGASLNSQYIPRVSDDIAFADNVAGNLYTNAFMKFEGQDVSVVTSFLAQTSALKKRLYKSHGWLKTIGQGAQMDVASKLSRTYLTSKEVPGDNDNGDTAILLKGCPTTNYGGTASPASVTAVAATGVVTGVNTDWLGAVNQGNQIFPGDIMVINGIKYSVAVVSNATHVTLSTLLSADIATATQDFYFLRQNLNTNTSKNIISVLWQPPLGIFDYKDFLGAGSYKISLTPDSNYLNNAIQTRNNFYKVVTNAANVDSFTFSINDVKLYIYQAKANIPDGPVTLDLMESLMMTKPITSNNSNGNYQFSVPPSTAYITIFAQDNRVGSSPLYSPSLFKCANSATTNGQPNPAPASYNSGDMTLTNIQCIYASITKPSTNWSSVWNVFTNPLAPVILPGGNPPLLPINSQTNQMVQRFYDSFLEFQNSANSGFGTETFNEWAQRGPFYMFVYARDQSDRSTEVQLNVTFSDISAANSNIFICAWYHNTVQYTVNNGMITALSSRQV